MIKKVDFFLHFCSTKWIKMFWIKIKFTFDRVVLHRTKDRQRDIFWPLNQLMCNICHIWSNRMNRDENRRYMSLNQIQVDSELDRRLGDSLAHLRTIFRSRDNVLLTLQRLKIRYYSDMNIQNYIYLHQYIEYDLLGYLLRHHTWS